MLEIKSEDNPRRKPAGEREEPLSGLENKPSLPSIPFSLEVLSGSPKVSAVSAAMNDAGAEKPVPAAPKNDKKKPPVFDATMMDMTLLQQPRDAFFQAAKDLLTKKASGNLVEHMISGETVAKWGDLLQVPSYYINGEDENLILEHGGYYSDIARHDGYTGPLTLFELGSGPASNKTRLIMNAVKPDNYIDAERSMEAVAAQMQMMGEEFPDVNSYAALTDFNHDNMNQSLILAPKRVVRPVKLDGTVEVNARRLPDKGRRLFVQFGASLGNMEGFANDPVPEKRVLGALKNYRRHAQPGDIFILAIDQNQDEQSLDECYGDEIHEKLANDTLVRMDKSLPTKGFYPDDFLFTHMWNRKNHLYTLGWQALHDIDMVVDGEKAHWDKYEMMLYSNGFRYPQKFMNALYPLADWQLVDVKPSPQKRMHHQVLMAVPGENHLSL